MILLTQHEITKDILPLIHSSLEDFVKGVGELYRESSIRINIHQLLHLIDDVTSWGLLWTHNSFIYESMNGTLMKFIHGTQSVPKGAIYALSCLQQIKIKELHIDFQSKEALLLFENFQKNASR
jgi:hypothetical protein